MAEKQNFLHLVKTALWSIHLPWQLLLLLVTQLPFLPLRTLFRKRNLRRKNHLPQSPRKLLRNQLLIRKWRSKIRSGRIDSIVWRPYLCQSPSNRPSHLLLKLHHLILLQLMFSETLNLSSNRPHQSALARTSLLCTSLPASSVKRLSLQSTLDRAPLLTSH